MFLVWRKLVSDSIAVMWQIATPFRTGPLILSSNVLPNHLSSLARMSRQITCFKPTWSAPINVWRRHDYGIVDFFFFPLAAFIRSLLSKNIHGGRKKRALYGKTKVRT